MRRTYTVSAEFPTRVNERFAVKDGDGNVCERITTLGTSQPYKDRNGDMRKSWRVNVEQIRQVS